MNIRTSILASLLMALLACIDQSAAANAAEGEPLAVRNWPGGMISVETHWGFNIVIDPHAPAIKQLPRPADRVLSSSDQFDHALTRKPNAPQPTWTPAEKLTANDAHAVHVKSISTAPEGPSCLILQSDGVRIVYVPQDVIQADGRFAVDETRQADLLILAAADERQLTNATIVAETKSLAPKYVLLNRLQPDQQPIAETFRKAIGSTATVKVHDHNTLALSHASDEKQPTQVVVMDDQPWQMPPELAALFAKMDQASSDSQQVFAKLSPRQLNFRPSNGTHTPRWNTEHMMGRQLLFFSQIYHAQDPVIPVMDLNPKQMPPDYVPAHPDWDGREEARQTQRVREFTRRFAYLLEGLDLDTKAPGSRWTPRGLLEQMARHYSEHTANTIKKFDLPDWPQK